MVFRRILLPLDGSAHAENSIFHAGCIARILGSRVTLLRVLDGTSEKGRTGSDSIDWRLRRAEAERYLRSLLDDRRLAGVEADVVVTEGRPASRIADCIRRHDINLVVMSSWGAGGEYEFPHGGTAHKVLVSTGISYLVVNDEGAGQREADTDAYNRILVPLDGSARAELAVHVATALGADHGGEIVFCHIVDEPGMPRRRPLTATEDSLKQQLIECNRRVAASYLEELRDQFGKSHQIRTRLEVAADPIDRIVAISREESPELMVLTACASRNINHWSRDSIMPALLAAVRVPVLVLQDNIHVPGEFAGEAE